jgi:hypothetical protein
MLSDLLLIISALNLQSLTNLNSLIPKEKNQESLTSNFFRNMESFISNYTMYNHILYHEQAWSGWSRNSTSFRKNILIFQPSAMFQTIMQLNQMHLFFSFAYWKRKLNDVKARSIRWRKDYGVGGDGGWIQVSLYS